MGDDPEGLSDGERRLLRELERLLQAMQHVMTRCDSPRLQSRGFSAQANLLLASLLYLRYSKRRYLKFYRVFNRFVMKCFLHEALMFWGYAASRCITDNTNLARLRGSGSRADIVPDMEAFLQRYGF